MKIVFNFLRLIVARFTLYIYLFTLIAAGAMVFRFLSVYELVAGLIILSESSALSSVVSFAQWIIAVDNIRYTFLIIFAAPIPLALIMSLLFSGAIGSFASGMEANCDYPAKKGISFWRGYKKRFAHIFTLFYAALLIALLMIFVWIVAAIPLAIIKELEGRGALRAAVSNVTLAVTALAVYIGALFLRVYTFSFIPALYSRSRKALVSAFSFAGRNFFRAAKYIVITDVIMIFFASLYDYFDNHIYALLIFCMITTTMVFFLLYTIFYLFAGDGYGYDEIEENDEKNFVTL